MHILEIGAVVPQSLSVRAGTRQRQTGGYSSVIVEHKSKENVIKKK